MDPTQNDGPPTPPGGLQGYGLQGGGKGAVLGKGQSDGPPSPPRGIARGGGVTRGKGGHKWGGGVGFVKGVGYPHLDEGGYIDFYCTGLFFAI